DPLSTASDDDGPAIQSIHGFRLSCWSQRHAVLRNEIFATYLAEVLLVLAEERLHCWKQLHDRSNLTLDVHSTPRQCHSHIQLPEPESVTVIGVHAHVD